MGRRIGSSKDSWVIYTLSTLLSEETIEGWLFWPCLEGLELTFRSLPFRVRLSLSLRGVNDGDWSYLLMYWLLSYRRPGHFRASEMGSRNRHINLAMLRKQEAQNPNRNLAEAYAKSGHTNCMIQSKGDRLAPSLAGTFTTCSVSSMRGPKRLPSWMRSTPREVIKRAE
jgi:hypothetical protein